MSSLFRSRTQALPFKSSKNKRPLFFFPKAAGAMIDQVIGPGSQDPSTIFIGRTHDSKSIKAKSRRRDAAPLMEQTAACINTSAATLSFSAIWSRTQIEPLRWCVIIRGVGACRVLSGVSVVNMGLFFPSHREQTAIQAVMDPQSFELFGNIYIYIFFK